MPWMKDPATGLLCSNCFEGRSELIKSINKNSEYHRRWFANCQPATFSGTKEQCIDCGRPVTLIDF